MKHEDHIHHVRTLLLALTGLLVLAAGPARAADDGEVVSERCGLCHEQETEEWAASKHADAITGEFFGVWQREGGKFECRVCHASRFDRQAGTYSDEGVTCTSCHGAISEDHPDDEKMKLPVTSETCQPCHSITYGEWRISAHGQQEIRCFDCHKMHGMHTRKDDPDQMCGTCHTERLEDFSHATHHEKGLHCISCHMPEISGKALKIKGTGARGHTTGVGAATCANCHREMVHEKGVQAELEAEVAQLRSQNPIELTHQLGEAQREADQMRAELQASKRVFAVVVLIAFALGLVVQYAILHRRWRARPRQ